MIVAKTDPDPREILENSPLPQLRRLHVDVREHEVIITGQVSSYYMRQLAQDAIRSWVGGRRIINRVEVCRN